jgi:hypothetical protein
VALVGTDVSVELVVFIIRVLLWLVTANVVPSSPSVLTRTRGHNIPEDGILKEIGTFSSPLLGFV